MEPTFIESDWFSRYIQTWQSLLGYLRGMPNLHALEIGSFEGRSACWMLQNILTHPTSRLTCVDTFEYGQESKDIAKQLNISIPDDIDLEKNFDRNIRATQRGNQVRKMRGDSREILRTLPLKSFDLIYIDGSHTTRDVLTDAVLSFDLLKLNGVMIFDDYNWPCFPNEPLKTPKMGIECFLQCFEHECVVFHKKDQVFLRRTADLHAGERELPSFT